MSRCFRCLVLVGMMLATFACQPEEDPFGTSQCPIIGGEPDTSQEHMAVAYLQMVEGNMAAACTGTLIGPRIVLTAAHCVQGFSADQVTVFFGNSTTGAQARHVSEVKWHSGYNSHNLSNDVAMVRLEENPPPGIVPIPFLPHSMGITSSDIGRPLEFVGFGVTETGASGTKMTVLNNLDWVCVSASGCNLGGGAYAAPNTICQDQYPGGPCSGDSGGPAFVNRSGREYVCGITSYGDADGCQIYGCSTKVDEFEDFIRSFAGDANGAACAEDVDCLSNACVDGVCCENTCAGRCEGCNQPGSAGLCVQLPDGTPCPDSDVCNGEEACSGGSCQRGEALQCHDSIDCTADTCDPVRGCDFKPLAADCDDQEICTRDLCDLQLGCIHEPLQDGLDCAKNMICLAGECKKDPSLEDGCGCGGGSPGSSRVLLLFVFLPLLFRFKNRAGDRAA
jgi:trypsin